MSDNNDNAEFIKREREFDRKKREKFLEDYERRKKEGRLNDDYVQYDSPIGPNLNSQYDEPIGPHARPTSHYDESFRRGSEPETEPRAKSKGIREKISEYRDERAYKRFKKHKDKEERREKVREQTQKKVFGKKLSPEEETEFEDFKEERREVKAERRRKVREGLGKIADTAQKVHERTKELNEGFGPGLDVGDMGTRPVGRDPLAEMFILRPAQQQPQQGKPVAPGRDPLMEMFSFKGPQPGESDPLVNFFKMPGGNLLGPAGGGAAQQPAKKKRAPDQPDPLVEFFRVRF